MGWRHHRQRLNPLLHSTGPESQIFRAHNDYFSFTFFGVGFEKNSNNWKPKWRQDWDFVWINGQVCGSLFPGWQGWEKRWSTLGMVRLDVLGQNLPAHSTQPALIQGSVTERDFMAWISLTVFQAFLSKILFLKQVFKLHRHWNPQSQQWVEHSVESKGRTYDLQI